MGRTNRRTISILCVVGFGTDLQDQYPGDRFDSLQIMINLKKIAIALAASTLIFGCTKLLVGEDPKNTAVDTFETFWHGVDATWPEFESKHANWDSVYSLYRPQVTASTQNADLQRIFQAMLPVLRDGHTDVYPNASTTIGYYPL